MAKIYLSYRRSDSSDVTGRIYDYLVQRYSPSDVYMDIESIAPGARFESAIEEAIRHCSIMLVIIGRNWLAGRLGQVGDIIRLEIEAGLSNGLLIIPVLVNGAPMPSVADLPTSIAVLANLNALQIRPDPDFRRDMDKLLYSIGHIQPAHEPTHGLFEWIFRNQRKRSATQTEPHTTLQPPATRSVEVQAQESRPRSIFISYKSEDRPIISALASALSESGYSVWYDQRLMGGHLWWNDILDNIAKADLFIFGLTPAALDSTPCQREYGYAYALRKRILPLLLVDGVDMRYLPPALQQIQGVRYRESDMNTFEALSEALEKLPLAESLPYPLPDPPPAPISPLGAIKEQLDAPDLSLEQQALMLHQLRGLMKAQDSADDALRLLRQLAEHRDARTSITDEIRQILG